MKKYILSLLFLVPSFFIQAQNNKDNDVTAIHILTYTTDDGLKSFIPKIKDYAAKGIDLIVLEVDYHFEFYSHPELREDSSYMKIKTAKAVAAECKKYNIKLVPEFQSFGHQSWAKNTWALLRKYPELDLTPGAYPNNEGIYCREWDPLNPKVNEIVFPLIEEILNAFDAKDLHMGMDEVFLFDKKEAKSTFGKNPAEVYAKVVNDFYNHFTKKKGVQLYMWGDRLIDGKVFPYGEWESSMNGTHPAVDLISKDIIICDWHYEPRSSYPSIDFFIDKGFRVLPCSYVNKEATKALIKYSYSFNKKGMIGHMFTSWGSVPADSLLLYPAFTNGLIVKQNKLFYDPLITVKELNKGAIQVEIASNLKGSEIRYTIDGQTPTNVSPIYKTPIQIKSSASLKSAVFNKTLIAGDVVEKKFEIALNTGIPVYAIPAESKKYKSNDSIYTLSNTNVGSISFSDGQWSGWENTDIQLDIDLGAVKNISEISLNSYHKPASWIHGANTFKIFISLDGEKYTELASEPEVKLVDYFKTIKMNQKTKARKIRVQIPKVIIPENNPGAGYGAWIFIDELLVK